MRYQFTGKIDIADFLGKAKTIPVIDVRSPSEFKTGHIPGSVNIPLFDDNSRKEVGIRYKKAGRRKAVIKGLELIGPELPGKLEAAIKEAVDEKLLVYCWRGGMRSETMAWLFSMGGIDTGVLEGGYKSYRNYILGKLSANRKMILLGGLTGSGKTLILNQIMKGGEQVVDLEALANHKGSAFGALGQAPQPTTEHFTNLLFNELDRLDPLKPVWLEDESRNIGTVFMPDKFFLNMQINPSIVLLMDIKTRIPRLLEEYSVYPPEELEEGIMKISRRLGGEKTTEAIRAVRNKDFARAIEITLDYYDKAYLYSLEKKPGRNIHYIATDTDNVEANSARVLETARKIAW